MQSIAIIQKSKMQFLIEELTSRNFNQFEQISENAILIKQPLSVRPLFIEAWYDINIQKFTSVDEAAGILKKSSDGLSLCNLETGWFKKADSIKHATQSLKSIPAIKFKQPLVLPVQSLIWGLLDTQTLFVSQPTIGQPPLGQYEFVESKTEPPSRAYLKLWNLLSVMDLKISTEDKILELGASPGGWSWVLAPTCGKLTCIDRSPLEPNLMKNSKITFLKGDAFSLSMTLAEQHDWIFSDLICEPQKLLESIVLWKKTNPKLGIVATIKFKGPTDFGILKEFKKIKGANLIHLYQNKHEVMLITRALK